MAFNSVTGNKEEIRFQPDWKSYPAVIIESDDWGSCEHAANHKTWKRLKASGLLGSSPFQDDTLESASDLNKLAALLGAYRDPEGLPAVLTAFACVANPDFARIRKSGFAAYYDLPIGRSLPGGWRRPGLRKAWGAAMWSGIFHPEFHTRLHHTQPMLWLESLRSKNSKAWKLFEENIYSQGSHIPEYDGMNPEEQQGWVRGGIENFVDWTGRTPLAAVCSDATPVTEIIWRANGIRTFCLRNFRNENGEVVVYTNKPWNSQSPYTPMGGWNSETDMVYLRRNVNFECGWKVGSADRTVEQIQRQWDSNEPAVLNCHRANLVSFNAGIREAGWRHLEDLIGKLSNLGPVRFLTSSECGDIYRQGWSARRFGNTLVLRTHTHAEGSLPLHGKPLSTSASPVVNWKETAGRWSFSCRPGDYVLRLPKQDSVVPAMHYE